MTALWWLAIGGPAWASPTQVEVCFEFQVDFNDAQYGDFWTNGNNRPARGIWYEITDDVQTHQGWADDNDGCVALTLELTPLAKAFTVQAVSKATVSGIEMRSYLSDTWEDKALEDSPQVNLMAAFATEFTVALPDTQVWHNLAVANWMMHRNTLGVDQGVSRDCCKKTADLLYYQPDGACGIWATSNNRYQRIAPPIHMFADPDPGGDDDSDHDFGCGRSTVKDASGGEHPALGVGNCASKFTLAHELGHVIVMMRMGGRTDDPRDAPLDNCMANYWDAALIDPVDDGSDKRSMFSKEYLSAAFREGWADFVAMWAWNRKSEWDCVIPGGYADLDLDGDIDNAQQKLIDCVGTPYVDTAEPASPVMDHINWLDDLETHNDPAGCVRDTDDTHEANRSTVHDVAKMFFRHVYAGGALTPREMSDLYVDMCPRGWAGRDTLTYGLTDELPLERLKISADHHNMLPDILHDLGHIDH